MSQPRQTTGTLRLKVSGELVEMTLTIPESKVPPQTMLPVFQQMTDSFVGAMSARATREGAPVTCGAGCSACCRQLIPLSEIEASTLTSHIRALPEPRQSQLRARFSATLQTLDENGLLDQLRHPAKAASLHQLGLDYLRLELPCPFLEDNLCSIHPIRPLVCREHLVTSPPENCDKPTAETVRKLPMPASVFGAVLNLTRKPGTTSSPFVPLVLLLETEVQPPEPQSGPALLKRVVENLSGKSLS